MNKCAVPRVKPEMSSVSVEQGLVESPETESSHSYLSQILYDGQNKLYRGWGWPDGLVGKDTCHQARQPELNPQEAHG